MNNFAIFGNPINHSLSPRIHELFSINTGIFYIYHRISIPIEKFEITISEFFNSNGLGANITIPFKERAFTICQQYTNRGYMAKSINTIKKQSNNILLGDNTDGIGLINDLKRLNWLHPNLRILVIGAGGAARGIIPSLLQYGSKVTITNRTYSNAKKLISLYNHLGNINIIPIDQLNSPNYDIIINATSASMHGNIPSLPESIITPNVCCYDMFYQKHHTPFIIWSKNNGTLNYVDGLGMLTYQAAESFLLWHGIQPAVIPVLEILRHELSN